MTPDRLLLTCLPVAMACPLFYGLEEDEVSRCLSHPEAILCNVPSGQAVQARLPAGAPCLGLLCRGRIRVSKPVSGDRRILISTLEAGGLFGAASLFTEQPEVGNDLRTLAPCTVALFPEPLLEAWFRQDFRLTRNYLGYLTGRIHFLNARIAGFTAGSAECRLAHYLLGRLPAGAEAGEVLLSTSMMALAQTLDISRASLYRAVENLEAQGVLCRRGKSMAIPDRGRLQAVSESGQNVDLEGRNRP